MGVGMGVDGERGYGAGADGKQLAGVKREENEIPRVRKYIFSRSYYLKLLTKPLRDTTC